MIHFFRSIRQILLSENKTGKYFKYAIGEIVLVVIGILIALSINTWNENKKQRVFEVKMLTEVHTALTSDIDYFLRLESRLHKLDSASNVFIKLVHEKAIFNDSLYNRGQSRWYFLRSGINLQFNKGPYEALKSSGIDKISNDSLRNSLVNFYDFEFPKQIAFINYYDEDYTENVEQLFSFLQDPFTELVNGKIEVYSKFPEDLFLRPEFLNLLTRIKSRATKSKRAVHYCVSQMEKLKAQISLEIN
ncbi:MAG: hypothetical protein BM564_02900 [Bacteroidetes bacterium MedPE-SWsnd-G2]|nr:MAG: hypothetical protein BM564_02900 [Bacteroidetes bacterium MedPE-SWsnd-G2]